MGYGGREIQEGRVLGIPMAVSTTNRHLTRALLIAEQQRHLPSASTETEPHAAIPVDLQQSLREFREINFTTFSKKVSNQ